MSGLELQGLARHYEDVRAVDDVSLQIPDGSFVCLLGPSGCGKTTLLRMIAGLEAPTTGSIRLDGKDLTDVPTHRRELGMVFQSLALFPHLDVGDNIAYALAIRGRPRAERRARVQELLELVRLPGIERRAVTALSGGQRQRVAIARALALSPRLFLLDEPLSALDAKLRETLQIELRELQQRLGVTTIVVTHDQREAMTMADLVVVMGEGKVRQFAPPVQIYRQPADAFVADFVGQTNLLPVTQGVGGAELFGQRMPGLSLDMVDGNACILSVRPEDIRLARLQDSAPLAENVQPALPGTVRFVRDLGASIETFVDLDGVAAHEREARQSIVAASMAQSARQTDEEASKVSREGTGSGNERGQLTQHLQIGDRVLVTFDAQRAVILPP